jgi:hypothetical protein
VPNVYPPIPNQEFWSGVWIGLDGYLGAGSNLVVQAGVGQTVSETGGAISRTVNLWYEWFPNNPVTITNVSVSPGDFVVMVISTSGPGSTTATLSFTNQSNGESTSVMFSAPTGSPLVGATAEWIVGGPVS